MAALKALAAQVVAWVLVLAALQLGVLASPSVLLLAFGQGVLAALIGVLLRSAIWWLPIHLLFSPAAVFAARLGLSPAWYFAAFVLLILIYWSSFRTQVPLFLTNRATSSALLALLPPQAGLTVMDLGCGTGRLLRWLAQQRPDCRFVGIETAPLPFLLARLAARGLPNCEVERADFWTCPLGEGDVIYAFLSPAPMARLWRKLASEMRPRSMFISNSFPVPDVAPERIVEVDDRRSTKLYVYRF